tara:strand:+ start:4178 stop:4729 length:552 start_codon:yes stop_codon:yes gene_type:complete
MKHIKHIFENNRVDIDFIKKDMKILVDASVVIESTIKKLIEKHGLIQNEHFNFDPYQVFGLFNFDGGFVEDPISVELLIDYKNDSFYTYPDVLNGRYRKGALTLSLLLIVHYPFGEVFDNTSNIDKYFNTSEEMDDKLKPFIQDLINNGFIVNIGESRSNLVIVYETSKIFNMNDETMRKINL